MDCSILGSYNMFEAKGFSSTACWCVSSKLLFNSVIERKTESDGEMPRIAFYRKFSDVKRPHPDRHLENGRD